MFPPFPPTAEIAAILMAENLFGWGFNSLIVWAQGNKIWDVSISVVIGVAVTLIMPAALWWRYELGFWQSALLLFGCFTASGIPMVIGSTRRSVKESHRRRSWPTAAAQARDAALMELTSIADEIASKTKSGEIKVQDMADVVHRLHQVKGTLKSV